ncbi:MAG: sugar transferase [Candidatus Gracilibacteria bacterium]
MLHHRPLKKSLMLSIIDICIFLIAFYSAYQVRLRGDYIPFLQLPIQDPNVNHLFVYLLTSLLIFCIVMLLFGAYTTHRITAIEASKRAMSGWFFSLFLTLSFIYLFHDFIIGGEIPRLIILYTWLFLGVGMIGIRMFFGGQDEDLSYLETVTVEIVDDRLIAHKNHQKTYTQEELLSIICEHQSHIYLIEPNVLSSKYCQKILDHMDTYGAEYLLIPGYLDRRIQRAKMTDFQGEVYLSFSPTQMSPADVALKRLLDIIIVLPAFIVLSPIFLLIWIALKIEDPSGPIIYKNIRVGKHGKFFTLYKFRYMYWKYCVKDGYGIDAQDDAALAYEEKLKSKNDTRKDALYKIKNDPRKMKIGKWIEKFSLDELPQLYNILIGDMSLVGPRPHQPREVEMYNEEYKRVLVISPGLTGMAQTHGRHHNSLSQEIALDLYYIDRWSIAFDLYIIVTTFFVVLKGKKD